MRRSICYCEPHTTHAGEVGTWHFIYTTSVALPKNTRVKFDLNSKGREIDWETPDVNLKKTEGVIYLELEDGTIVAGRTVDVPQSFVPQFEFTLPQAVPAGHSFKIILGAKDAKKGKGIRAQTVTQRRRSFLLYVDPTGKQRYGEPETFNMDIMGNVLHDIRILAPSMVAKNKRFDIVVRFEDEYGNLTGYAPDDTLIELSHEHLRENLNWKLFVPETGFITLPNLYFNENGVYRIILHNTATKVDFRSCPIQCVTDTPPFLFWGLLHGESDKVDSTENIESCLRHFRDERALNFYAISPFENQEETPSEVWKNIVQVSQEFDEEDRFSSFIGFQWVGEKGEEGVRQILFLKDQKQIIRKKEAKGASLSKLYKSSSPKELISIPSFTMGKGYDYDFNNFSPEFERVVEIYNAWGSSECGEKEGNRCPIQGTPKNGGVTSTIDGAIQKALQKNYRFGFVAGGLDDRGIYAPFFDSDQTQYPPGLTAIVASHHSRNSLAEALYQRSCYATTGERIIVTFSIAGHSMGSEISTAQRPGLTVHRHIMGSVAGTAKIFSVEIIRNGTVIHTYNPNTTFFNFGFDDQDPLSKAAFPAKNGKLPFVYYYLRITQEDGHQAWISPIWIDVAPNTSLKRTKVEGKKSSKAQVVQEVVEVEEEEDDVEE